MNILNSVLVHLLVSSPSPPLHVCCGCFVDGSVHRSPFSQCGLDRPPLELTGAAWPDSQPWKPPRKCNFHSSHHPWRSKPSVSIPTFSTSFALLPSCWCESFKNPPAAFFFFLPVSLFCLHSPHFDSFHNLLLFFFYDSSDRCFHI